MESAALMCQAARAKALLVRQDGEGTMKLPYVDPRVRVVTRLGAGDWGEAALGVRHGSAGRMEAGHRAED